MKILYKKYAAVRICLQITLRYLCFTPDHSDGALAPNKPGRVAPPKSGVKLQSLAIDLQT